MFICFHLLEKGKTFATLFQKFDVMSSINVQYFLTYLNILLKPRGTKEAFSFNFFKDWALGAHFLRIFFC